MKRVFSLYILILAVYACACLSALANDAQETDILYYGDYAYTVKDGQATIVDSVYNLGYGEGFPEERPGMEDEDASPDYPSGTLWRVMVIPDTLGGYPVVAIGDENGERQPLGELEE